MAVMRRYRQSRQLSPLGLIRWGAVHFGNKTLRHRKIAAEVSGHFGTKALLTMFNLR